MRPQQNAITAVDAAREIPLLTQDEVRRLWAAIQNKREWAVLLGLDAEVWGTDQDRQNKMVSTRGARRGSKKGRSMLPKHPLFEQHWREFTEEHPEMLPRGRYVLESDKEEAELSVDLIAFMHFVRWAKQKGYGPAGITGLIPWVRATYRPVEEEYREQDGSRP